MKLHRAIVVDDETFTRKGLLQLMDWQACGFEIVGEADNGEDALELISRIHPDLVITDIRMPVLDGLELIRSVLEQSTEHPAFIILSGYSDFAYAQQAIRYGVHDFMLKPIDEGDFSATLRKLSERLHREQQNAQRYQNHHAGGLLETVMMNPVDDVVVTQWEQQLRLGEATYMYYVLVELNDQHPWRSGADGVMLSLFQFRELIEQALHRLMDGKYPLYVHEHRNRIGLIVPDFFLGCFEGKVEVFMKALQREIEGMKTLKDQLGSRVFVYAGKPVNWLQDIQQSYACAKEAVLHKYIYDNSGIVVYLQEGMPPLHYKTIPQDVLDRLTEQVEELRLDELRVAVDYLFSSFREECYAPEAMKMSLHQCLLSIVRVIQNMQGNERSLQSLEPMMNWQDMNLSLGELQRLFTAFAEESGRYIGVLRKDCQQGGIQHIRAYIEQHAAENISLKSIAARFYMNPVYLGQLFRKTYGVYFNEFLLKLRVQEAKRLLRQTDLRIYEIAERVGFGSSDYFVTQFEKMAHATPSEYRNSLSIGDESERAGE
ncbi:MULTISPECIES: response regulator [Paenibacillus]|uniref:response regulator transcription factor n=1 Tax=Paenibacillus TaxID=44249 RepID=UPI0006A720F4|nr:MULTISPECIES: response regulator [Paenibacillus]ALA44465.1 chemotaxis protein CheY [Paenibacillus peoriae]MCP3745617.1 response regulator [Paenibacillus sp. A3M_27_13]ODB57929.1 DNA-binding response regulator [Paenibacillus polymyxa]OMF36374.1 DNA-binding response regulator [Paenibacillus peoriae]